MHAGEALRENLRGNKCLHCGSDNIRPYFAIEQETKPPFEYWHTIIVRCFDCDRGQLERAYYDSADGEETFDQTEWYLLEEDSMERLADFIKRGATGSCPEPLSPGCLCAVHWQLTEASNRLEPPADDELLRSGGKVSAEFVAERGAAFLKREN